MVTAVHSLGEKYHIHRDDRAARLVLTIGDQAIQGPGSIGFTKEEFRRDAIQADPLSEAICKFHIADGIGTCVDHCFQETEMYDRLLRLIRRHFAFGIGKLNLWRKSSRRKLRSIVPKWPDWRQIAS